MLACYLTPSTGSRHPILPPRRKVTESDARNGGNVTITIHVHPVQNAPPPTDIKKKKKTRSKLAILKRERRSRVEEDEKKERTKKSVQRPSS